MDNMAVSMLKLCLVLPGFLWFVAAQAQFDPPAGQPGSRAIHADSLVFIGWADDVLVERGWIHAGNESLGKVTYGNENDALGKADLSVISLGDGGSAMFTFQFPLWNGPGPDFAVFENSFSDDFLELAFVEVSSNGEYFVRFQAVSFTQTEVQVDGFGHLDATQVHNLAGKFRAMHGVPFDLEELEGDPNLNIQSITHIRIVDVVGSIDPLLGSFDKNGRLINDPWPTPFPTSGFDLDALGVIHDARNLSVNQPRAKSMRLFPQPARQSINFSLPNDYADCHVNIMDMQGNLLFSGGCPNDGSVFIEHFMPGSYILQLVFSDEAFHKVFLKQ
jgi:hypothetical protein